MLSLAMLAHLYIYVCQLAPLQSGDAVSGWQRMMGVAVYSSGRQPAMYTSPFITLLPLRIRRDGIPCGAHPSVGVGVVGLCGF